VLDFDSESFSEINSIQACHGSYILKAYAKDLVVSLYLLLFIYLWYLLTQLLLAYEWITGIIRI